MEEAEVRCGSAEKLQAAVQGGRIKVGQNHEGIQMFFFPTCKAGKTQEGIRSTIGERAKGSTPAALEAWSGTVEDMEWSMGGPPGKAPNDAAGGPPAIEDFCYMHMPNRDLDQRLSVQ